MQNDNKKLGQLRSSGAKAGKNSGACGPVYLILDSAKYMSGYEDLAKVFA